MRALMIHGPGRIEFGDFKEPPLPPGECRVAVRLTGICRTDLELAKGYLGFRGIPGHEFVGVVSEGPEDWRGRRVIGEINVPCRKPDCFYCSRDFGRHCPKRSVLGILGRPGAFAESLRLPPTNLVPIPDSIPDEEAVFAEPLAAVLEIFEQVHVPPGQRTLVIGDGKLGLLAAQVFSLYGCPVTLAGRHEKKLALARRWGCRTRRIAKPAEGLKGAPIRLDEDREGEERALYEEGPFPLAIEASGSPSGLALALDLAAPRGTVVLKSTLAQGGTASLDLTPAVLREVTLVGSRCGPLRAALRMLAPGRLDVRSMIDHRMDLSQAVEAFERAGRPGTLKVLIGIAKG